MVKARAAWVRLAMPPASVWVTRPVQTNSIRVGSNVLDCIDIKRQLGQIAHCDVDPVTFSQLLMVKKTIGAENEWHR
jgi:hypothetical protein